MIDTSSTSTDMPAPAPREETAPATRAYEDAVYAAWSALKAVDNSPRAQRIHAEMAAIWLRRRPAADTNPYRGTFELDDLGLDRSQSLAALAGQYRSTAEMLDDRNRADPDPGRADDVLWWHAVADALDELGRLHGPDAVAVPSRTSRASAEERHRQWRSDDLVLRQAENLFEDDESPAAQQLRADADRIGRQRCQAHADAVKAGIRPCPAAWSLTHQCLHTDGDGHTGQCFSAGAGHWPRAISYFAPDTDR